MSTHTHTHTHYAWACNFLTPPCAMICLEAVPCILCISLLVMPCHACQLQHDAPTVHCLQVRRCVRIHHQCQSRRRAAGRCANMTTTNQRAPYTSSSLVRQNVSFNVVMSCCSSGSGRRRRQCSRQCTDRNPASSSHSAGTNKARRLSRRG